MRRTGGDPYGLLLSTLGLVDVGHVHSETVRLRIGECNDYRRGAGRGATVSEGGKPWYLASASWYCFSNYFGVML